MTTIGLDFVVMKDNRGYECGFFWSDVQQIIGVYKTNEWVEVKFRNDHEGIYSLSLKMPVNEFLEQVKKQLTYPTRSYSDGEFFLTHETKDAITPMSIEED